MKYRWARLALVAAFTASILAMPDGLCDPKSAYKAFSSGNYNAAFPLVKMMAEKGDKNYMRALASMYEIGMGVPKDNAQALYWYKAAADRHDAEALAAMGRFYMSGTCGVSKDYKKAFEYYQKADNLGSAVARSGLAILYLKGWGVEQDYDKSLRLAQMSALQGGTVAQYNLGDMYRRGKGTAPNLDEAQKWYARSADKLLDAGRRDPQSYQTHMALGTMYTKGLGVKKDPKVGALWFAKGMPKLQAKVKAGNVDAIFMLAEMNAAGDGVPQNDAEALRLFKLAASKGDNEAKHIVAVLEQANKKEAGGESTPASEPTSGTTSAAESTSAVDSHSTTEPAK